MLLKWYESVHCLHSQGLEVKSWFLLLMPIFIPVDCLMLCVFCRSIALHNPPHISTLNLNAEQQAERTAHAGSLMT